MTELPQRIICQATLDGKPVKGVWVNIGFGVTEKNSYHFVLGPTNHDGCTVITKDQILKEAAQTSSLGLMDFEPLEGAFDGNIIIKPMTRKDIQGAIQAHDLFTSVVAYRKGYRKDLEEALKAELLDHLERVVLKQLR